MLDSSGNPVRTLVRKRRGSNAAASPTRGTAVTTQVASSRKVCTGHAWSSRSTVARSCSRIRFASTRPRRRSLSFASHPASSPRTATDGTTGSPPYYEIDELARAMMLVNGRRRVLSRFRATEGRLVWFGLIDGRSVPTRNVRDPPACVRSRGQPLGANASGLRPGPVHRVRAGHRERGCREALRDQGLHRCPQVPMDLRRSQGNSARKASRAAGPGSAWHLCALRRERQVRGPSRGGRVGHRRGVTAGPRRPSTATLCARGTDQSRMAR